MSVHSAVSAVGKSEAHKLWKLHLILWIRWRGFTATFICKPCGYHGYGVNDMDFKTLPYKYAKNA